MQKTGGLGVDPLNTASHGGAVTPSEDTPIREQPLVPWLCSEGVGDLWNVYPEPSEQGVLRILCHPLTESPNSST